MATAVMQSRMNITTAITPRRRKEKKVKKKDQQIRTKKERLHHKMEGTAVRIRLPEQ